MSNFMWSKNEIKENGISEVLKQELCKELENVDEKTTLSYKNSRTSTFREFKKRYRRDKKTQKIDLGGITDTSLSFVQELDKEIYQPFDTACPSIIPENLIQFSIKFYSFLNDPMLTKEYMLYLLNERNHINIGYAEGQNVTKLYKGCIKKDQTTSIYLSYYIENNLTDFINYLHETAHVLATKLFRDKMNPLIKKHFIEVEAYFIEFLACYFLGIDTKDETLKDTLIFKSLEEVYDRGKTLIIQDLAAKHIFRPKDTRIKEELEKLSITNEISPLDEYLKNYYGQIKDIYNSILIAYDLYSSCNDDIEECLYEYKRFLLSDITDPTKLFKEFNITYPYDECKNAIQAIKRFSR